MDQAETLIRFRVGVVDFFDGVQNDIKPLVADGVDPDLQVHVIRLFHHGGHDFLGIVDDPVDAGGVGVFFKDEVEEIFGSGLMVVGCCLLVTATLLIFSYYARPRQKRHTSLRDAFIIGLAQAAAVMPGLSRSGSTIATGILLGNNKEKLAQFSFLMVIPPILGEALLDVMKMAKGENVMGNTEAFPLLVGFVAAFISGFLACKWMINIVKHGKLVYFGIYCAVVGVITIITQLV